MPKLGRPSSRGLVFLVGVLLVLAGSHAFADEPQISTEAPSIYRDAIAQLLTPLENILSKEAEYAKMEGEGAILLDESIHYLDAQGKKYSVYHTIYKALSASGVKSVSEDTTAFSKETQRLYMVLAQTIQPDGSKHPVKADGIIIKTPQNDAQNTIYNDEVEVVVIYPNIKVGSIVEQIILIEEIKPKIAGHFTQTYTWSCGWPCYRQHLVVDLPNNYADRLKATPVGELTVTASTSRPTPDRKRLSWEKLNVPGNYSTETRPPSRQIGPLLWLSTLENWDSYADWYAGLVRGTDELTPEMKAKVDEWTKGTEDPEQILRILHGHVSFDVRYTGIEFGISSLKPHSCASVWERKYGDCKDKANLLRAMLAHKNIPAWLTLVNTEHAGLIAKGSPDYRQFDHCILTAKPGKSYIYCDPTITFGVPGILSANVSDRDALVIKGSKSEWVHTPAFTDSAISYSFDLKLQPSGEIAGWVSLECTGYYALSYPKSFQDQTKEQVLSSFGNMVRQFFPNTEVVDIEPFKTPLDAPNTGTVQPFKMRAYMVLGGVLTQGDATSFLKFPNPSSLLPDIDQYKKRKYSTFIWPDTTKISAKIQLPPGWGAESLPAPFEYNSTAADVRAGWSQNNDVISTVFQTIIKQPLFPPAEMLNVGNVVSTLQTWAAKPLTLAKSGNNSSSTADPAVTDAGLATGLPVMPTGDGQINLIEFEFPKNGNIKARRLALEQISSLFPTDVKSIARASILLAAMDLDEEKWKESDDRIQSLLSVNRSALSPGTVAWAEYIKAIAMEGLGKKTEAAAIFERLGEDTANNHFRRAWSYHHAAEILQYTDPAKAMDLLDKGISLEGKGDSEMSLYQLYASVCIGHGGAQRLKQRLSDLIHDKPDNLVELLLGLAESTKTLITSDKRQEGLELLALLESLSHPETTGTALASELKKTRSMAQSSDLYKKIQQDIRKSLNQFPEMAALEKKQPPFSSKADAQKILLQHEENGEADDAIGCALRIATAFAADDTFADDFWQCVKYAEWSLRKNATPEKTALMEQLVGIGLSLPHALDAYADTRLISARILERQGKRHEAGVIYGELAQDPDVPEYFRGSILERSGINWEEQNQFVKALENYKRAETFSDSQNGAQRALLRAAFIQFDNGNQTESLRLLKLVAQSNQKGKIKTSEQVRQILATIENTPPGETPAHWALWNNWWPKWQEMQKITEAGHTGERKVVPVILSVSDLLDELGAAREGKNVPAMMEGLRKLAHASRIYPEACLAFADGLSHAGGLLTEQANDWRRLSILVLEPISYTSQENQRSRILSLLINYTDTNQEDKALDLIRRDWHSPLQDNSPTSFAINRVWSIAAIRKKQDLDKVQAALENDVKATRSRDHRLAVIKLADIYHAMGKIKEEGDLLENESASPAFAAEPTTLRQIKSRLDNLRNALLDNKKLTAGVNAWLKVSRPVWWDYAEPKSATDPRISRLDEILQGNSGTLTTPEIIKTCLLSVSSSELTYETQCAAVQKAFSLMLENCRTLPEADALAKSILQNEALPDFLRRQFLFNLLIKLQMTRKVEAYEAYRKLPLAEGFTDNQKSVAERIGDYIRVDRTSTAELVSYIKKTTQRPMDLLDLGIVEDCLDYILILGQIETAESIYRDSATYAIGDNVPTTRPEFQLKLLRKINATKAHAPLSNAFRKVALEHFKTDAITKPGDYDLRMDFGTLDDLSENEAQQYRLYQIKLHQEPPNTVFWQEFLGGLTSDEAGAALKLSFIKAGIQNSKDDDIRAALVRLGTHSIDLDDPVQRKTLLALIKENEDISRYPHMSEEIRMLNARMALRDGRTENLESDFADMQTVGNQYAAIVYKMRAYRTNKDSKSLKKLLESLSADVLMHPNLLHSTLPALESAGMKDEALLVRETLQRKMYQDLLDCWFAPTEDALLSVCNSMQALEQTGDIPAAFSDSALSRILRPKTLHSYQLQLAYIEKDWPKAAAIAQKLVNDYPTYYSYYWYLGRCQAELGKKDESIKALTVYCRYSKDEESYPDATELLAKLKAHSN